MKTNKLFIILLLIISSITTQAQNFKEVLIESSLHYLTDQHGLKKDNTEVYINTTIFIDYKYKQLTFKQNNSIIVYKIVNFVKLNKDIIKIVLFDSVNNSSVECHYSGKHRFILFLNGEKNKLYLIN
jgi:hypothetical protein